jgi:hypothetical protein
MNPGMKKMTLTGFLIFLTISSMSQTMPEAFLSAIPALPKYPCSITSDDRDEYVAKVTDLQNLIEAEIDRRNSETESNGDASEQKANAKLAKQYGLTEDELKKLQDSDGTGNQTEEDKLVNKAMLGKSNISMAEVKGMDKMKEKEITEWGEAYGTEGMVDAQLNPEESKESQKQTKNMYELAKMQKHILDSLQAIEKNFADQLMIIENDTTRIGMLSRINKWEAEIAELGGEISPTEEQKVEQLLKKVTSEKSIYCEKFTPDLIEIMERYESYTRSCLHVCYRLEDITNQLTQLQTGVKMESQPGTLGIKKIKSYTEKLNDALVYNLILKPSY